METNSPAGWVRRSPRYLFAILTVAAAAYALDKWFFLGVTASKWIGLPDYAALMRETQNQSRNWGIAALILEALAIVLLLPRKQRQGSLHLGGPDPIAAGPESLSPRFYIARCAIRSLLCVLGTIAFAVVIPLAANLFSR